MNATLLRRVYRLHGIKRKKYRWYKVSPAMDDADIRRELARMKRQLTMAKNAGYRLVYLDETMFTRKTVADTEWSCPGENFRVDTARLNEPTLALLAAISKEKGHEYSKVFLKSVDVPKL